jgi:hypothetical protein
MQLHQIAPCRRVVDVVSRLVVSRAKLRIYRDVVELRRAIETFVTLFNEQWRPEKNG